MSGRFRYRPEILSALEALNVHPKPWTDPVMVRDYLKALYTMEIRTMRVGETHRLRSGERMEPKEYARRVVELREKYRVLSIPVRWWAEG
ncbi:MAG TPA: hypothetical protein VM534_08005 [Thermoanaerobaculia bacterium]|nr:hypothetical protein [Thermoanaerobaculia bacterium]